MVALEPNAVPNNQHTISRTNTGLAAIDNVVNNNINGKPTQKAPGYDDFSEYTLKIQGD